MSNPHKTLPLDTPTPLPVYGCADERCACDSSYPAGYLYWFRGNSNVPSGWYCEPCGEKYEIPVLGIGLDEFLDAVETDRAISR